jgi:Mg2+ and Co2+ transporter CorA
MFDFFTWLRQKNDERRNEWQRKQALVETLEELVDIADPKIRLASHYREALLAPVERAVTHCRRMAHAIPGPVRLNQKAYYNNPLVKSLFRSVEEMEMLLRQGRDATSPGGNREVFSLLTMTMTETVIYGHKQQGEMILADVPMKAVTFVDHRLLAPCPNLQETISKLVQLGLEIMAGAAMEKIGTLKANLTELRERRTRLSSMQRILSGKRRAFEIFAQSERENAAKLKEVQDLLSDTEREIEAAKKEIEMPEDQLTYLLRIMAFPAGTLALREQSLNLNWMNVLMEDDEEPFHTIDLAELALNDELRRSAILVSFDR